MNVSVEIVEIVVVHCVLLPFGLDGRLERTLLQLGTVELNASQNLERAQHRMEIAVGSINLAILRLRIAERANELRFRHLVRFNLHGMIIGEAVAQVKPTIPECG